MRFDFSPRSQILETVILKKYPFFTFQIAHFLQIYQSRWFILSETLEIPKIILLLHFQLPTFYKIINRDGLWWAKRLESIFYTSDFRFPILRKCPRTLCQIIHVRVFFLHFINRDGLLWAKRLKSIVILKKVSIFFI